LRGRNCLDFFAELEQTSEWRCAAFFVPFPSDGPRLSLKRFKAIVNSTRADIVIDSALGAALKS
jgi:hypothetical protein